MSNSSRRGPVISVLAMILASVFLDRGRSFFVERAFRAMRDFLRIGQHTSLYLGTLCFGTIVTDLMPEFRWLGWVTGGPPGCPEPAADGPGCFSSDRGHPAFSALL
jgi:hypothetical protein